MYFKNIFDLSINVNKLFIKNIILFNNFSSLLFFLLKWIIYLVYF